MKRLLIAVILFSFAVIGPAWSAETQKSDPAASAVSEGKAENTGLAGFVEKLFGIFNFNDKKVDRKSYGEDSEKLGPAYNNYNRNTGMTDRVSSDRGFDL